MLTPDAVTEIPTAALTDLGLAAAVLANATYEVNDCEGLVVSLGDWLETAVHVIDAELQSRHVTIAV